MSEQSQKKVYSHQKVRTSTQDRTLDSMFPTASRPTPAQSRTHSQGDNAGGDSGEGEQSPFVADEVEEEAPAPIKLRDIPESECYLTTVLELRKEIVKGKHHSEELPLAFKEDIYAFMLSGLSEILSGCVYVGTVDLERCLSLLQHNTELYLVNHGAIAYAPALSPPPPLPH